MYGQRAVIDHEFFSLFFFFFFCEAMPLPQADVGNPAPCAAPESLIVC